MSKLDNRDQKIKQILQKDKLISKKADDVFNNFLKEERKMGEKDLNQKQETKIKKFSAWKKGLATAACVAIVAGGANIYATTKGYENVLFMIKYLVTGENKEVTDKNAILSDRDITISYEPIQLTENIRMQVRRLQIVDGQATLMLVIHEDELVEDKVVVPLKYVVTNNKNETLCDMTSSKEKNDVEYVDELKLSNLYEDDKTLNLEIFRNNGQKITKLIIDIESQTITVEGAEEAMKKISEIDLKSFLGIVSAYPELNGDDDDAKIFLSIVANPYDTNADRSGIAYIGEYDMYSIKVSRTNQLLREMGYSEISNSFERGYMFNKITYQGEEYYTFNDPGDQTFGNTCINISNMSYSGGLYKATFTYTDSIGEDGGFELDPEDMNIYEGTVFFKINENNEFIKYQIVKFEDMITINYMQEVGEIDEELIDVDGELLPTPYTTPMPTPVQTLKPYSGIDNYATSLSWREYWAPGLKVQYPDYFSVTEYSTYSEVVSNPTEKSVILEGDLTGVDPETKEPVVSHMKITVYKPQHSDAKTNEEFARESSANILGNTPDMLGAGQTDSKGEFWYNTSSVTNGTRQQLFTIFFPEVDAGLKVLIEYDDVSNYKVVNVINWIISTLRSTSV